MSNKIRLLLIVLFTIFSTISLCNYIVLSGGKVNMLDSFRQGTLTSLLLGIALFLFYRKVCFKKKSHWTIYVLAFVFSIFMIIGDSFKLMDSFGLIIGNFNLFIVSIIRFIGYFVIIFSLLNVVYSFFVDSKWEFKIDDRLKKMFDEKPMLFSVIVMLVCWLPYIISFYPAILSPDPSNQIRQFFGIKTAYVDSVIPLDENVTITNHHPVLHTVLLGGSVKIGRMIGSDNIGLFLYSIIQIAILVSVLAFTIKYMKKLDTPYWLRFLTLIIYALVPVFPLYAMSAVKDVIFGSLIILYIIFLFDIIKDKGISFNLKKVLLILMLLVFITLFRNNGIHVIILSFPFLFLVVNKNKLLLLGILLVVCSSYYMYNNKLLPYLKIAPGSVREMLSVPFQQTARYVKYHSDDVTKKEKKVIDKILVYDTLKDRYKSNISDPVKNEFNRDATEEDLNDYFNVWFNQLKRHPKTYIEATVSNIYGYVYPNTSNWYIYFLYDTRLREDGFGYQYNGLEVPRNILSGYGLAYPHLPVIGMIVNIGFNVWIILMLFMFLIRLKRYRYLIYLLPSIALILVCFLSPVNTYFRYALPYVFALPITIAMFKNIIEKEV